jgi:peroxiredoxin
MKKMGLLLLFVCALPVPVLHAQTPAKKIPAFTFYKQDNSPFTTTDLARNKKLFFVFFDTGCDHCQRSVTALNKRYTELAGAAVYFITLDPKEKVDRFMQQYGNALSKQSNVQLLQDKQFQFIPRFQPKKYPSMFLYAATNNLLLYDDREEAVPVFLAMIKGKGK